ncbi:MAG: sulfurtransferase TusA family protein [Anaerolineae bacterium]
MSVAVKADQTLDCRGLLCPMPVIRTRQAIDDLAVGQVLEMIATDPGSKADMEAWTRQTGHELLAWEREGGVYRYFIRKTQ